MERQPIAKLYVRLEDMNCFKRRMKRLHEIDPEYAKDIEEILKEFNREAKVAFIKAMFIDFVKISNPEYCPEVPQLQLGDIVNCRNDFSAGYWTGHVSRITFQCNDKYVVEVDKYVGGDGGAMFSTDMLEHRNGEWWEL